MTIVPRVVWEVGALLGEGPAWFGRERALRFVDIKGGRVHRFDPASGERGTLDVGGLPSFILPGSGGEEIVGSRHGIYRLRDGALGECVAAIPQPDHNRTNDATVDPLGRLWFGTMDDAEERSTGLLWCLANGALHQAGPDAVVTNGPAISPDGRTLYHVDSGQRTIWRYEVADTPAVTGGEVFVRLGEDEGFPDGIVVDAEGCLWVALWDGWAVRRYGTDGTLLLQIDFPCARVTKLAFGGPDLRTAFVTTARVGLTPAQLEAQPLAGALFAFEAPVAGVPLPEVKLG